MRLEGLWSYFTDPAKVNRWLPMNMTAIQPELGGVIEFDQLRATIVAYDCPQMFAFELNEDQFRFETHPEPDVQLQTLLVFRYLGRDAVSDPEVKMRWTRALNDLAQLLDR